MPPPPAVQPAEGRAVPAASSEPIASRQARPGGSFALPKLRLEVRNLADAGASTFLSSVHAADLLAAATRDVLGWLYVSPQCPTTTPPPTRSVTLVLRDMDGVAYTTGSELDDDHKEVHLSTRYVAAVKPPSRAAHEITGVVTHELVHCFQHNAFGTCPGGLVEGVADWVRLRCGLAPPHWDRAADGGSWDAGYQHTAYFLDYLEGRFGDGTVRRLNEKLRIQRYDEATFWLELLGHDVNKLWEAYRDKLGEAAAGKGGDQDAGDK